MICSRSRHDPQVLNGLVPFQKKRQITAGYSSGLLRRPALPVPSALPSWSCKVFNTGKYVIFGLDI
jgi:hypothetical protein